MYERFIEETDKIKNRAWATKIKYFVKGKNGTRKVIEECDNFIVYSPEKCNPFYDVSAYEERDPLPYIAIGRYGKERVKKDGTISALMLVFHNPNCMWKGQTRYYDGEGNEISKDEYELVNKPKAYKAPTNPNYTTACYTIKINNILEINGVRL